MCAGALADRTVRHNLVDEPDTESIEALLADAVVDGRARRLLIPMGRT